MSFFIRTSKLTSATTRSLPSRLFTTTITRSFSNTNRIMGVHNLANKVEFDAALKDNKIVVLDAFATWCGPCKAIAPKIVSFSETHTGAHFVKIDVDECPDVAQELGVRAMPTFMIFKNGEKIQEIVGANPVALEAAIANALKDE
ncbi:thioredoxin [Calycina marina]|uniref:Thioredoxin n=1 Tax=Calycina marina TaxID=1763456 RepID=A0A9P7Z2H3_9HELO|nr:thioredoxin [Calycina marina]